MNMKTNKQTKLCLSKTNTLFTLHGIYNYIVLDTVLKYYYFKGIK